MLRSHPSTITTNSCQINGEMTQPLSLKQYIFFVIVPLGLMRIWGWTLFPPMIQPEKQQINHFISYYATPTLHRVINTRLKLNLVLQGWCKQPIRMCLFCISFLLFFNCASLTCWCWGSCRLELHHLLTPSLWPPPQNQRWRASSCSKNPTCGDAML